MSLVILYRWRVEEGQQEAFRLQWEQATEALRVLGSLGSCLTRNADDEYVAIALWPDEATRDHAFSHRAVSSLPGIVPVAQEKLQVVADRWSGSPFMPG